MNSKKNFIFICIVTILSGGFLGFYLNHQSLRNDSYTAEKVSKNIDNSTINSSNTLINSSNTNSDYSNKTINTNSLQENNTSYSSINSETKSILLASFSTKIYNKDSDRQKNISLTCSTLNNTIVAKNSEFSFNSVLGKSTSDKGYEKADVYEDGEVVKALGGGKCQVSSTLYNAVLNLSGITITERHKHGGTVPYVAEGKDAAVAYGSYDFKFKNNNYYDLKISASNTKNKITIKIYKINS